MEVADLRVEPDTLDRRGALHADQGVEEREHGIRAIASLAVDYLTTGRTQ